MREFLGNGRLLVGIEIDIPGGTLRFRRRELEAWVVEHSPVTPGR